MRRLKGWQRWVVIGSALIIVMIIIGSLVGGGDDKKVEPSAAAPTTTRTATTTDEATPAPVAPADTGRMSEGEWDTAKTAVFDLNGELADYRNKLSTECVAILSGGEIKNSLDCFDQAYDGVEGQIGLTYQQLDDLRGDVGLKCLKAVTTARNVANVPLFQAAQASKRALGSLDQGAMSATLINLRRQSARWGKASGDMLQLCAPS